MKKTVGSVRLMPCCHTPIDELYSTVRISGRMKISEAWPVATTIRPTLLDWAHTTTRLWAGAPFADMAATISCLAGGE